MPEKPQSHRRSSWQQFRPRCQGHLLLTDLANFARVNGVYAQYLNANLPARSTVQVAGLPKNADIEIEAISAYNFTGDANEPIQISAPA